MALRMAYHSASMMLGAEVGRHSRVAAKRQRRDDQQQDQDFAEAPHAGNPITDDFCRLS